MQCVHRTAALSSSLRGLQVSAPVGVRANLRMALQHILICCPDETVQKAIEDADDVTAELLEAAVRVNGDHAAPHDCYATGPLTGNPIADLVACPGCALANAISRCGGAK